MLFNVIQHNVMKSNVMWHKVTQGNVIWIGNAMRVVKIRERERLCHWEPASRLAHCLSCAFTLKLASDGGDDDDCQGFICTYY